MLSALNMRIWPTIRSNCICLCPHTTREALRPAETVNNFSSAVNRVNIVESLCGVALQKSSHGIKIYVDSVESL
jgi:hypothetical protein